MDQNKQIIVLGSGKNANKTYKFIKKKWVFKLLTQINTKRLNK